MSFNIGMAVSLLLTIPVLLSHQWPLVFVAAATLGATFGLRLRHLSDVAIVEFPGRAWLASRHRLGWVIVDVASNPLFHLGILLGLVYLSLIHI